MVPPDPPEALHLPEVGVDPVQPVPELIEGGGVQGEVRNLEGLSAGQRPVAPGTGPAGRPWGFAGAQSYPLHSLLPHRPAVPGPDLDESHRPTHRFYPAAAASHRNRRSATTALSWSALTGVCIGFHVGAWRVISKSGLGSGQGSGSSHTRLQNRPRCSNHLSQAMP